MIKKRTKFPIVTMCTTLLTLSTNLPLTQNVFAEANTNAPIIEGVEDGRIYCEQQIVKISDENLADVTVNDIPVTLSADGTFVIEPASKIQTIKATDTDGNVTSVSIAVNRSHIYENDVCTSCDQANPNNVLMSSTDKSQIFGNQISRDSIKSIEIYNSLSSASESAWDVSQNKSGGVLAWVTTDADGWNHLYLAADGYIVANENSSILFGYYSNLEEIKGIEYLNTRKVTNMSYMFFECKNLNELNTITFDTSNVDNMNYMFYDCSSLQAVYPDNFDTSNVTAMAWMFGNCTNLRELNVGSFDTEKVTDMYCMFSGCSNLQSLDLTNFNTSNVANMATMFLNCGNLQELKVDNFVTNNVTDMYAMFSGCSSLQSLNLNSFDTSNVTNMKQMFSGCSSLQQLNIDNFNTFNVTDMHAMFFACSSLRELNVSNFNTNNVTDMGNMFVNCSSLQTLDVDGFDISNVIDMSDMFLGCSSLQNVNLDRFNAN